MYMHILSRVLVASLLMHACIVGTHVLIIMSELILRVSLVDMNNFDHTNQYVMLTIKCLKFLKRFFVIDLCSGVC